MDSPPYIFSCYWIKWHLYYKPLEYHQRIPVSVTDYNVKIRCVLEQTCLLLPLPLDTILKSAKISDGIIIAKDMVNVFALTSGGACSARPLHDL